MQMSSQRGHGVTAGRWGSGVSVASVQLLERIVDKLEQNPLSVIARNTQVVYAQNSNKYTLKS